MTATALRPTPPASRHRPCPRPTAPRRTPRPSAPRASAGHSGVATRRPADRQRTVVVRQDERAAVPAAVYRRRRLAAVAIATLLVAVVALLAGRVGHADAELDGAPPAPAVYVVQPGDTLWTIAARVAPDADRRDVVAQLADAAGGSELVPGQRIELPRYFD